MTETTTTEEAKVVPMEKPMPKVEPIPAGAKRILCYFDFAANTGYGTVSKNIIRELRKAYPDTDTKNPLLIDIVAINYFDKMYRYDKLTRVISAQGNDPRKDDFGRYTFLNTLISNDYDAVFILQDVGVICPLSAIMKEVLTAKRKNNNRQFKSIFYFPVDCTFSELNLKGAEFFDTLITYNEYGRKEVVRVRPDLRKKLRVIPHGMNVSEFHPLPEAEALAFRKEYFGKNADKFIINATNRNQPRKDIPNVLLAFNEYRFKNPNALLYLHMHPKDPLGFDLRAQIAQLGLTEGENVVFPPEEMYAKGGCATEVLNKLYNASDCYLTMNRGEGWGLTVVEAMACKKPVIAPLHTSFYEIGDDGNRIYALQELYFTCNQVDNMYREACDYREAAEMLETVCYDVINNTTRYRQKVDDAYGYVQSLAWPNVGKYFVDIFKDNL